MLLYVIKLSDKGTQQDIPDLGYIFSEK